jgi:outer membrane protein OmpA-like peptidoglycan-associated protein
MTRMYKALSALLTTALLSGCSMDTLLGTPPKPTASGSALSAARCAEVFAAPDTLPGGSTAPRDATVLLADGSASTYTKAGNAQRQGWEPMLAAGFPKGGNVLVNVGVFGGSVDWKFTKVTPGKSTDENRSGNDLNDARACFTHDLGGALATPASRPQTDVLRALAQGADQVRDRPGAKWLYIATDGLSNTGCADLRATPIDDNAAFDGIVRGCAPELPKLDKTFHVQFLGLGYPGAGWPDVKTPNRNWLLELWRRLCAATGAQCEEPTGQAPRPTSTGTGTPTLDAEVPMPRIDIAQGDPTVVTVPASLLFDVDSAELASGRSQEALGEILSFLRSVRYTRVEITGHTDSTGTPAHNRTLSTKRAEAVLRALQLKGVSGLTAAGKGQADPACTPEYKSGIPDRIAMACNRRVEISVYR